MTRVSYECSHCGGVGSQASGAVNRARRKAAPLFCSRECSGARRRINRTDAEKRALKAIYDSQYRAREPDKRKADKAEYHKRTYDPASAAEKRSRRMPSHVEYCRRPAYRKWKAEYDRQYRATKDFGPFGEAAIILQDLQTEILTRATRYEIDLASGTLNKKLKRRRDYDQAVRS